MNEVVSEAFVRFFVEIVGHYPLFLTAGEREERTLQLQREAFRKAVSSKSLRRFLEVFMETQTFRGFIQERELRRQDAKGRGPTISSGVAFPLLPASSSSASSPLSSSPQLDQTLRDSLPPLSLESLPRFLRPPLVPSALLPHPLRGAPGMDRGGEAGPHPPLHVLPPTPSGLAVGKEDSREPPSPAWGARGPPLHPLPVPRFSGSPSVLLVSLSVPVPVAGFHHASSDQEREVCGRG